MLRRNSTLKVRTPLKRDTSRLKRSRLNPRRKKPPAKARIDYAQFAIAKQEKPVPVMWTYDDGRVQYNLRHPQGEHLYRGAIRFRPSSATNLHS